MNAFSPPMPPRPPSLSEAQQKAQRDEAIRARDIAAAANAVRTLKIIEAHVQAGFPSNEVSLTQERIANAVRIYCAHEISTAG